MPAVLTHNFFGLEVIERLEGAAFSQGDARDLFLLGNQGSDPFFYALRTPRLVDLKKFGSLLHHQKVEESTDAMRRYIQGLPPAEAALVDAYFCGYLCHFSLDSTEHPFVIAQEIEICAAGVKGLDESARSIVHGQIEADLDAMMLYRLTGKTIREYRYTTDVLHARDQVLGLLDGLYRHVALEVFGQRLPRHAFTRCVKDMRTTARLLYSSTGRRRAALGRIERLVRTHSLAQAMSHRADVQATCDFDNHAGAVWVNPFNGELSVDSFTELFDKALTAAVDRLQAHEQGVPTGLLTGGLNFEGKRS
ncbi:MAG: hypothetical protein LBS98_03275 [Coriobacteriales bacterium]|jgi:hypothetical protein|nr:hypothetical protein [Coriobacteriales bacterium]